RFKLSSSVTLVLSPSLSQSESISTIVVSQANFKRIIIPPCNSPIDGKDSDVELLCVMGDILKKIKKKKSSEILDPPVANVDHVLLLFTMEQPTIEPFMLTRFLVEAESTDLPLTFAFNKTKLVDEEGRILMLYYSKQCFVCGFQFHYKLRIGNMKYNWFENRRVGKVSTRGRGKHTTRHVSLLSLSGVSYLANTPRYTVGDMGVQRAEPQLEPKRPKKHRRQSRKKINQSIVDELNDDDNLHLEIDPIVRATKNENQ
ncbi:hypothetical protein Gohar_000040, partial [Gossypium harknessii]|nr:hypothetical protein [Gossypium harknessii]